MAADLEGAAGREAAVLQSLSDQELGRAWAQAGAPQRGPFMDEFSRRYWARQELAAESGGALDLTPWDELRPPPLTPSQRGWIAQRRWREQAARRRKAR